MAASKAQQEQEGRDRVVTGSAEDAALALEARQTVDDSASPDDEGAVAPRQEVVETEAPRPAPIVRNTNDDMRAAIVDGFRKGRVTDEIADDEAEIRRFAHEGMPPELSELEEPEAPEVEEAPAPKIKVKVRGQEIELTQEELIAAARKSIAADDYLDEARRTLDNAKALADDIQATRTGLSGKPPAAEKVATEVDQPTDGEPPANPLRKVIEDLQYGADPEQVTASLDQILDQKAEQKSKQTLANQRVADEAARSKKALTDFQTDETNADIAKDPLANAAIERRLYDLQMEDLKALGVDETVLRTRLGRDPGPNDIATWHLFYRAEGFSVRPVPALLKQASEDFKAWKGTKPDGDKPSKTVEVVVDRTARRAAIPQQPSRTSAPRPDAVARPKPTDRSTVVQNMIAARNRPRGVVVG